MAKNAIPHKVSAEQAECVLSTSRPLGHLNKCFCFTKCIYNVGIGCIAREPSGLENLNLFFLTFAVDSLVIYLKTSGVEICFGENRF